MNLFSRKITIRSIYIILIVCLSVMVVILPNSVKNETAVLMVISFFVSLPIVKWNKYLVLIGLLYLLSLIVTLTYSIIGLSNNAPIIAIEQILIIYIISPLMWMIICIAIFQSISSTKIINFFIVLAILCCISVAVFFFIYLNYGSSSVYFFIKNANLNLTNGYAGATMFVYGSLIFICSAFFAMPNIIKSSPLRLLVLSSLALCAVTSGRSALILSLPIGLAVGVLLKAEGESLKLTQAGLMKCVKNIFLFSISIVLLITFLSYISDISIEYIAQDFISKLLEGGGDERVEQFNALLNGIYQSQGMGVGHGVGVAYIRDEEFPWRYELVWVATVFRVGIVGAFFYAMPFLIYIYFILKISFKKGLNSCQKFFFAGFVAAFIASNTNPYIESFVFQWMYIAPLISLIAVHQSIDS